MTSKGYMIFTLPAATAIYRNLVNDIELDFTLVIIAIVTSLVGSTMQITHKNLDMKKKGMKNITSVEIYAIYVTGVVFGMISYLVGHEQKNLLYAMIIGVFGSYMSLDLFKGIRIAVLAIVKQLPEIVIEHYLKSKGKSNGEGKNN